MSRAFGGYLNFLWAGVFKQAQTGAIVPSQRFLIERMIAPVPVDYDGEIVELGAGNGALTLRLAGRCPAARIIACEINPILARDHERNLAAAGLNNQVRLFLGSAERLLSEIRCGNKELPEFVISGIPLGNFGGKRVLTIIDSISQTLAAGGMYIQYQHSLLDRKRIKARFSTLRTIPVLLNFPPAMVYYARR